MPVIFSRNADSLIRHGAAGVAISAVLVVAGFYYYMLPSYTRVGYAPDQPVPFSHQIHAGQLGMDCRYCHQSVEESPHASVPASQVCMNCHNPEKANVKGKSPLLALVQESYKNGNPVEWKRIHQLPHYAYFNHALHVKSGVSCVSCHGQINEMKVVYHAKELSMGWCLNCHNHSHEVLREPTDVYNLALQMTPKEQLEKGNQIKDRFKLNPPQNCQGCHR